MNKYRNTLKNLKLLIILSFTIISLNTFSQPFIYVDPGFVEVMQGAGAWTDYNKDGHLDAFITGDRYSGNEQFVFTGLYRNLKDDKFSYIKTGIKNVYISALDWGDYDKDGDDDLVLTGQMSNGEFISAVYRNNRSSFTLMNIYLVPVRYGSVQWGDFDNDNDLDILLSGETRDGNIVTKVYSNEGNNKFVDLKIPLTPVYMGSATWKDFDGDDDLDILVIGETYNSRCVGKLYRNEGNLNFVETNNYILPVGMSSAQWGDLDNDGDFDIITTGETQTGRLSTNIYINNGSGQFTEVENFLDACMAGNIDLGDYDHDGDLDIVITGESYEWSITRVYRNEGNMEFIDIHAGLPGVSLGGAYWGDYDNDGDLDILLLGLDNCYDFTTRIFRNDGVYEKKVEEKPLTAHSIFTAKEITIVRPSYYYFVYASCFCDPFQEGEKKFHAFVGNIHYSSRKYELMEKFNNIIIKNLETWPKVDAGHRVSIGFETKKEAEEGRRKVINEYIQEGFIVHYVKW